jgi:UDP-2,3-diacylglucosamine pyrophosphatase LpxH
VAPDCGANSRKRVTAILSDVHLSQAHPDDPADPLWMRYRRREFHPDRDFEELVDRLLTEHGDDRIEIVWNGDVFDFDAPWVKDGISSFEEFPLTDDGCAAHVRRIVADHPIWFGAAARLLLAGHRLLILSGNHDIELVWPGVRRAIRDELGRLASQRGGALAEADLDERVRFRAWFHVTEDGIYLEHGSQYDVFNGVRYAMLPFTRARNWIHPQMGKLAFKRTGSQMGYFNPYYEETFYMGLFGYLGHFVRYYAFSRRHIVRTWFWGSVETALEIWRHRHRDDWTAENRALARAETGASDEAIDRTFRLGARPAEDTMLPILRELWLDRLALTSVLVLSVGIAWLAGGRLSAGVTLAVLLALFALYEIRTPKPDIRTYDSAPPEVRELLDIHGAHALCMGHTHRPFGSWEGGGGARDEGPSPRFFGNSGSWCPAFHDDRCTSPVLGRRPLILLTSEGGALSGGLFWWDRAGLVPDARCFRRASARPRNLAKES